MKTNRKDFILNSVLAIAGVSSGLPAFAKAMETGFKTDPIGPVNSIPENEAFKISIFSKNLQWLGYGEMAQVAAEIGFDGIDITVRPGGHILPERVSEDLPKAVDAVRKAGLNVYMITTAIIDANEPSTEGILKTASSLGIRHYRTGWLNYDEKKNIEENLSNFENQFTELAILNKQYAIYGEYQNHSGAYFGAPIWDLYTVLNRINSPWIGSQYDILHATVEGTNTWPIGLKLLKPYIKSIDIKDFQWAKKDGKWIPEMVPLGEGFVDFKNYLGLLKQYMISAPVSLHYEYSLGGAEHGATTLTMQRKDVIAAMKFDCDTLKKLLRAAELIK